MRNFKTTFRSRATSLLSPDWALGAVGSRTQSSFWMWECLALLAVPVATLGFLAMAAAIGVLRLS